MFVMRYQVSVTSRITIIVAVGAAINADKYWSNTDISHNNCYHLGDFHLMKKLYGKTLQFNFTD